MPRNLPSLMVSGAGSITSNLVRPALLAKLGFRSRTEYVWTGIGDLVYSGNTYRGVGAFGKISRVGAGTDLAAQGVTVSLSGIDPDLLADSLGDIQLGAPATVWLALFDETMQMIGPPYSLFVGLVDKPIIVPGTKDITISLQLETRFANLQRPNARRYTAADQQLYYPDDSSFQWVEQLNDQALKWA